MLLLLQQNLGFAWGSVGLVTVPNVVGETQAQAITDIQSVGLVESVSTAFSSTVAVGLVISQSPTGGSSVTPGSTVSIVVSLGAEPASATGAGRKRRRRKYIVEIDGQDFAVDTVDEAEELISKAKAIMETIVERARANVTVIQHGIKLPQIRTPDAALVPVVQKARKELRSIYDEVKRDLEIRYLFAKAQEDEDEEIIRLLM